MATSYRKQKLEAIRLDPLQCEAVVKKLEREIKACRKELHQKVRTLIFFWSLFISAFITLAGYIPSQNLVVAAALGGIFLIVTFVVTFLPPIIRWLAENDRYKDELNEIKGLEQEIQRIKFRAQAYQERMEPFEGPGFLALYKDILLSEAFTCELPQESVQACVEASLAAKGSEIALSDYSHILASLKTTGIPEPIKEKELAESVAAKAMDKVVYDFAELLMNKLDQHSLKELEVAALCGLNARLGFHFQVLESAAREQWDAAQALFESCLSDSVDKCLLIKAQILDIQQAAA